MKMCLTLTLMLLASVAAAADQARPAVSDVALREDGVLRGQVLATTGTPQAKSQIVLVKSGKVVAATMTDANGEFVVASVSPGLYQIESPHAGGVYRLWAPRTAPPAAKNGVFMIGDANVVRAQIFGDQYGPAIRGAIAGGLITGLTYWALDYNPTGS